MSKKYLLTKLLLQNHDRKLYSENPSESFLHRVLERGIPPLNWLRDKRINSISDGIIWLTNGVDFYPAWESELVPYHGDEPVGTLIEEKEAETA